MAVRVPSAVAVSKGSLQVTWSGIAQTDTTQPFSFGGAFPDKTVSVGGVFGAGATVSIMGSNDGVTYVKLNDSRGEGNPLDFLTAGGNDMRTILENPFYIRVDLAGGDGTTALSVAVLAGSTRR
jgi:hypothetical protein